MSAGDLGVRQFLIGEIDSKMALFNRLAEDECNDECEDFCDECCGDCDCENGCDC